MDEGTRRQFLAALRTDDAFRAAVRREVVGNELLALVASAADPVVEDLRKTVDTLVDVVAEHRRELDLLAVTPPARGLDDAIRRDLATLAVGLGEVRARVAALAETTARHAEQLAALAEASAPILPLVQNGFVAIRDALTGLVSGMQSTQRELAELRETGIGVVDLRDAPAGERRPV